MRRSRKKSAPLAGKKKSRPRELLQQEPPPSGARAEPRDAGWKGTSPG